MANKPNKTVEAAEKAVSNVVADVKAEVKKAEDVVVHLIGTVAQKTGPHFVAAAEGVAVQFHDGVATVSADVAKLLKKLGIAE